MKNANSQTPSQTYWMSQWVGSVLFCETFQVVLIAANISEPLLWGLRFSVVPGPDGRHQQKACSRCIISQPSQTLVQEHIEVAEVNGSVGWRHCWELTILTSSLEVSGMDWHHSRGSRQVGIGEQARLEYEWPDRVQCFDSLLTGSQSL